VKYYENVEALLPDLGPMADCGRKVDMVVLHHTWSPDHAQWQGKTSAAGILNYWLAQQKEKGWRQPLGGHFIVDPDGGIYLPFDDLTLPLNANSNVHANHCGVAIETVGNFDAHHDALAGAQLHAVNGLLAGLCVAFGLSEQSVMFHRNYTNQKTCPGTSIDRDTVRAAVANAIPWARPQMHPEP
jgi:hypothetical protein